MRNNKGKKSSNFLVPVPMIHDSHTTYGWKSLWWGWIRCKGRKNRFLESQLTVTRCGLWVRFCVKRSATTHNYPHVSSCHHGEAVSHLLAYWLHSTPNPFSFNHYHRSWRRLCQLPSQMSFGALFWPMKCKEKSFGKFWESFFRAVLKHGIFLNEYRFFS